MSKAVKTCTRTCQDPRSEVVTFMRSTCHQFVTLIFCYNPFQRFVTLRLFEDCQSFWFGIWVSDLICRVAKILNLGVAWVCQKVPNHRSKAICVSTTWHDSHVPIISYFLHFFGHHSAQKLSVKLNLWESFYVFHALQLLFLYLQFRKSRLHRTEVENDENHIGPRGSWSFPSHTLHEVPHILGLQTNGKSMKQHKVTWYRQHDSTWLHGWKPNVAVKKQPVSHRVIHHVIHQSQFSLNLCTYIALRKYVAPKHNFWWAKVLVLLPKRAERVSRKFGRAATSNCWL